jgi:hypothetical protein
VVGSGSEPFQFVLDSELFFFEGNDPGLVPIGMGQFVADEFFEFPMFGGKFLDMPF